MALLLAACGGGGGEDAQDEPSIEGATRTIAHDFGETTVPVEPERLVVLGEEFLLANVLALGITPIASTLTLDEASGLEDYDVSGIQALPATEPNVELLASLDPDMILAPNFVVDVIGYETISTIAPTVAIADGDWRASAEFVGMSLGREDRMTELLTGYDAALAEGRADLGLGDGETLDVSMATIYPGPQLAFWFAGPSEFPQTAADLGLRFVPDESAFGSSGAAEGRAYVSLEETIQLQAPHLFLLQSTRVEGEQASYDELARSNSFADLPAVQTGQVHVFDRLGFPGVEGRTRLIDEYVAALT